MQNPKFLTKVGQDFEETKNYVDPKQRAFKHSLTCQHISFVWCQSLHDILFEHGHFLNLLELLTTIVLLMVPIRESLRIGQALHVVGYYLIHHKHIFWNILPHCILTLVDTHLNLIRSLPFGTLGVEANTLLLQFELWIRQAFIQVSNSQKFMMFKLSLAKLSTSPTLTIERSNQGTVTRTTRTS